MPSDVALLKQLRATLQNSFVDKKLRIAGLARAVGISERHFQRRLRELTGFTPVQFLVEFRLQKARDYLRSGVAVGDVAHATGFSSHAYFAYRFKKRFELTPSAFRKQVRDVELRTKNRT